MSRSQGQRIMSNYTTQTRKIEEQFLEDKEEVTRLQDLYQNEKHIYDVKDTGEYKAHKHYSVQNKRGSKSKKRLSSENSKFLKILEIVPELYRYCLNFRDIDPNRAKLGNMYHKQRYEALVRILDNEIQGSYICNLEYGVFTGLHAYILCGKQNSGILKAEKPIDLKKYKTTVFYMSKEFVSDPTQEGNYKEFYNGHYQEAKDLYYAAAGKVIDCVKKKIKRHRQIIYRLKR